MKGSAYYDEVYATRHSKHLCGSKLSFHKNHFAAQVMREHCRQGRWLDLGCGCGQKDWYAASVNSVEIVGIDFSPIALGLARALPPNKIQWVRGDIMALPFAPASFDGCICSHVLEHIEKPRELLAEMVRVTKPRGCLVIVVPHLYYADDPSHVWHFTPQQLAALLEPLGWIDCLELSERGGQIAAVMYLWEKEDET